MHMIENIFVPAKIFLALLVRVLMRKYVEWHVPIEQRMSGIKRAIETSSSSSCCYDHIRGDNHNPDQRELKRRRKQSIKYNILHMFNVIAAIRERKVAGSKTEKPGTGGKEREREKISDFDVRLISLACRKFPQRNGWERGCWWWEKWRELLRFLPDLAGYISPAENEEG